MHDTHNTTKGSYMYMPWYEHKQCMSNNTVASNPCIFFLQLSAKLLHGRPGFKASGTACVLPHTGTAAGPPGHHHQHPLQ